MDFFYTYSACILEEFFAFERGVCEEECETERWRKRECISEWACKCFLRPPLLADPSPMPVREVGGV